MLRKNQVNNDRSITEKLLLFENGRHLAMLYTPSRPAAKASVAVILMHCDMNYMGIQMGPALAERGYTVIAADSWQGGVIDRKIEYLGQIIRMLRNLENNKKIILMGHSGGATLMTAYQAIAEKGVGVFQCENMIFPCTVRGSLDPADGVMLIDANYGNGVMSLVSLDPAVIEEGNGMALDPQFDAFSEENGYHPEGSCYSEDFISKYQQAQAARNRRLIDAACERLEKIRSGHGNYEDDEPFVITAADQPKPNNRLIPQDVRLLSHTKGEYDLLHGDGTVTHERIRCVRTPECDHCFSNNYEMGANKNTVRGFLSSQAIRTLEDFRITEDGIIGIDWNSSYASPIGNIEYIQVPALFMGMTGSYEFLAAEMICQHAKMDDKTISFIHGASHMFGPNHKAERYYGEFGNTEQVLYDAMAEWLERFVE